ncbi:MAG: hypothetical protein AAB481_00670 [Patescibacteria group bacterium]
MKAETAGSTLIELLLYMVIFVSLLGMLLGVFSSIINVQLESEATSSVTTDGKFILARISYDIGQAQTISIPAAPGAGGDTLQLESSGVPYAYAQSNGTLTLTAGSTTDILTGVDTTISNLTFLRLGNGGGKHSIRISFTLTSKTIKRTGPEVRSFQTTIAMR